LENFIIEEEIKLQHSITASLEKENFLVEWWQNAWIRWPKLYGNGYV